LLVKRPAQQRPLFPAQELSSEQRVIPILEIGRITDEKSSG